MRSLTCPCDAVFEADLPESVDLDSRPEAEAEILEGTFLTARCPRCGNLVKPDISVRVLSGKRGLDIQVVPELERYAFYRGSVAVPGGAEAVIGYRELVERMRAVRSGLSPRALEIVKYLLLARAQQDAPEAEIVIEFAGLDDGALVFDLWGLKEGEAGVLRVPRGVYDKTLGELDRRAAEEPFARIFGGAYRSIRVLEAEPEEDA